MNSLLKGALISSLVVIGFALSFHGIIVKPNDWSAVAMWLPLYISPIWGIAGVSLLSEKGKE